MPIVTTWVLVMSCWTLCISVYLDKEWRSVSVQIYFEVALHCVNHAVFVLQLSDVGVVRAPLDFITGDLNGRVQKIVINGEWSSYASVVSCVP